MIYSAECNRGAGLAWRRGRRSLLPNVQYDSLIDTNIVF